MNGPLVKMRGGREFNGPACHAIMAKAELIKGMK